MLNFQELEDQWEMLCKTIRTKRSAGQVIVIRAPHAASDNPWQIANQLVISTGWILPPEWTAIDRDTAVAILAECLHHDLAYHVELQPRPSAEAQATAIVDTVGSDALFFTNGSLAIPNVQDRSWNSITTATFDTGVIAIGRRWGILCWFLDED